MSLFPSPLTFDTVEDVSFGSRIEEARVARGMSQGDIERELKVSQGYVSRLISGDRGGKRPSDKLVQDLSRILRVREEWLRSAEKPRDLPSIETRELDSLLTFDGAPREAMTISVVLTLPQFSANQPRGDSDDSRRQTSTSRSRTSSESGT